MSMKSSSFHVGLPPGSEPNKSIEVHKEPQHGDNSSTRSGSITFIP
jgi:hypothetical protein